MRVTWVLSADGWAHRTPEDVAAGVVGSFSGIRMLSHVTCDRRDLHDRLTK